MQKEAEELEKDFSVPIPYADLAYPCPQGLCNTIPLLV